MNSKKYTPCRLDDQRKGRRLPVVEHPSAYKQKKKKNFGVCSEDDVRRRRRRGREEDGAKFRYVNERRSILDFEPSHKRTMRLGIWSSVT